MSNFSTAMPRTTSSPPTAGLGWGWCSPAPGRTQPGTALAQRGSGGRRGLRPGRSPSSNGAFTVPGGLGALRGGHGAHRTASGLDKAHTQLTHGPGSAHACGTASGPSSRSGQQRVHEPAACRAAAGLAALRPATTRARSGDPAPASPAGGPTQGPGASSTDPARLAASLATITPRMPAWQGSEGTPGDPPAQPPAQAGSPRAGGTAPRPGGLEYLQRKRLHSLPGQPGPGLRHPQREEVLPRVQLELPLLQFVPAAPRPLPRGSSRRPARPPSSPSGPQDRDGGRQRPGHSAGSPLQEGAPAAGHHADLTSASGPPAPWQRRPLPTAPGPRLCLCQPAHRQLRGATLGDPSTNPMPQPGVRGRGAQPGAGGRSTCWSSGLAGHPAGG